MTDSNSIARTAGVVALREGFDRGGQVDGHPIEFDPNAPWWRDPATIPPREFLYGRHYIRRTIGATIAAGGRGKTTLSVYEAVEMTAGFDLVTREPLPKGPVSVWLLNGEEEQDELDRRAAAVCKRYRVSRADLGGRLFVESVRERPMRIATMVKTVPTIDEAVVTRMIDFISRHRIDVFMVDPLVSFHDVPENDNSAMDKVIKQGFGAVAARTNTAGEVFHHPGKPKQGQAETTVEDGRGASAILWAVRSARVLNFMLPVDADKLGMSDEERKLHVRIGNGKANNAPLGKAKWMKIEVEILPNGDHVACASPWKLPDPFKGLSTEDLKLAQKLAQTGAYRDDSRSPEWFGYALAEHLGINIKPDGSGDPKDFARVKTIIKTWKDNNVLSVEKRKDDHRKEKAFIVAGSNAKGGVSSQYVDDDEAVLQ